jgi:hypothetical protein
VRRLLTDHKSTEISQKSARLVLTSLLDMNLPSHFGPAEDSILNSTHTPCSGNEDIVHSHHAALAPPALGPRGSLAANILQTPA